jgi:hypothetical protein
VIVHLSGGLGNQMFQAAFGFSVAGKRNEELFFDRSSFILDNLRHYQLDAYNLDMKFTPGYFGPYYEEKSAFFDEEVYRQPEGTFFKGYWQSERWWDKDLVYNLFRMPAGTPNEKCLQMARLIDFQPSCFIGVRRADYLWPERINYHGVMPLSYYREACELIPNGTKLFIFTDDVPWAVENLGSVGEIVDVNGENEKQWDIWLMSLCKYAIIANSTFHWWGAWLGPDRNGGTIIAPKKWFVADIPNETVPERWIQI